MTMIHLVTENGGYEINLEELTREQANQLISAGKSIEFVPARIKLERFYLDENIKHEKPRKKVVRESRSHAKKRKNIEIILGSLHFRAYCNLTRQRYSLDDIAGYVLLTPEELKPFEKDFKKHYKNQYGQLYGAEYFFKSGRDKRHQDEK